MRESVVKATKVKGGCTKEWADGYHGFADKKAGWISQGSGDL